MKFRKIYIVSPVFPPYYAGIGLVAYYHAKYLQKFGYQVEVITPNYIGGKSVTRELFDNIPVIRLHPLFHFGNAAFIPSITNIFTKDDLVHLHYPFFGGAEAVCFNKKKIGYHLILHYHMDVFGQGWRKFLFKIYNALFLYKFLNLSDKLIVTTHDYAVHSFIKDYYHSHKNKIVELYNGVDTYLFNAQEKDKGILEKMDLLFYKVILFVGALDRAHYFKGVTFLLHSLVDVPKAKLIIVGDGDMRKIYERIAHDLGIFHRVIFAGRVTQTELVKYYNICDLFVLPSVDSSEAFGMVLLEAAACAKPIVATRLPGVRHVAENLGGYIAEPGDAKSLSDIINRMLHNGSFLQEKGMYAKLACEENFNWEKIARQLIEIYDALS